MSVLASALEMARRGFRVFPLGVNSKEPAVKSFQTVATTDPAVIQSWFVDPVLGIERDGNYGVLCTDRVVVDVDIKHGRNGLAEYEALGGHFNSFVVRTPSGGYHIYYEAGDYAPAVNLVPGVDVRSHNSYVVGPGSVIDGVMYHVVVDSEPAWIPLEIERRLRPPGRRDPREAEGVELDDPASLLLAADWLLHNAPVAVEGHGGDDTTYRVAARVVRDYALTPETACDLLLRHWNDRCVPPWNVDELLTKCENAAAYGTRELGSELPATTFGAVQIPPPEAERSPEELGLVFGNAIRPAALPPRRWRMEGFLATGHVTMIGAAGAAGKSLLILAAAAHLVHGLDFAGWRVVAPCKVVIWNGEDDIEEQSRRLIAICQHYGFDFEETASRIMLIDATVMPLMLAGRNASGMFANGDDMRRLVSLCQSPDVGVLIVEPLIEFHQLDENDNVQMRFLMNVLKTIAREADVALLSAHHGAKGKAATPGSADLFRGATSITSNARVNLTLVPMTPDEAQALAIDEADRGDFVRIDGAKINHARRSYLPTWMRWHTVLLGSGDRVGVLAPTDIGDIEATVRERIAAVAYETSRAQGKGAFDLSTLKVALQQHDELWRKMTEAVLESKIRTALTNGVRYQDAYVQYVRQPIGNGSQSRPLITVQ